MIDLDIVAWRRVGACYLADMHEPVATLVLAAFLSVAALSAEAAPTRTICGSRDGTAGNASLVDRKGRDVIVLASQGGDQSLLDQADGFLGPDAKGESGTQNGTRYCLVVRVDRAGRPLAVVGARRQ